MLSKEDLQKIIDQFDEEELKREGIFGILQYGGDSDESFIRANKEGLELFALKLLKSAKDTDAIHSKENENTTPIDSGENWVDDNSNTFIQYIELIADKQIAKQKEDSTPTIADKLMPYGCGILLTILGISVLVGLVTILDWLFK